MSTLTEIVTETSILLGDKYVGQFFTTAELKKAIGDAYKYYYEKLVTKGEGYFERTDDLDIVANEETVTVADLNPVYLAKSKLQRYVTTGTIPLKFNEQRFTPNYTLGTGTGDAYIPGYYQRGRDIILVPFPLFSETDALKLEYVYLPDFPNSTSDDGFEFDANFPTIYELNIEYRAAIQALATKDVTAGITSIDTLKTTLNEMDMAFSESSENDDTPDSVTYSGINYNNILGRY